MKYLMQFPGRHAANRIARAHADLEEYLVRWERDQQVCRAVCVLHFRDGLSYVDISAWLRGGPSWGRRTAAQVRGIVARAKRDCDLLAGASVEQREE